jgi:hypothetical protein
MATNGTVKGAEPLDFTKFQNVINGKLVDTKETRRTINPSTFEELYPVPVSTQADIDEAIEVAKKAQESWANVPWAERQQAVKNYADALEALSEDFAKQLTTEQGKPVNTPSFLFTLLYPHPTTNLAYCAPLCSWLTIVPRKCLHRPSLAMPSSGFANCLISPSQKM